MAKSISDAASRQDYVRPELVAVQPDLNLMAHLLAGTRKMWEHAQTYIRQWADEDPNIWQIRSKCEEVFEGLGRTLSAAVGMVFARDPTIEWNAGEAEMQQDWENIDGAGTAGPVFIKRFTERALQDGVGLILVDFPPRRKDPVTKELLLITPEEEQQFFLRPTWARYPRANVLNWRTGKLDNREIITQLTLYEPTVVPDGIYGVKTVERYRVLQVIEQGAAWTVWEKIKETNQITDFKYVNGSFFYNNAGEIAPALPIGIAHTGRSDQQLVATVPLLGVAWSNLGHWQISTNHRFNLDLACFAQPVVVGEFADEPGADGELVPGELKIGPVMTIHLKGEDASFEWAAPPTDAFEPTGKAIEQKERHMAKLGMSFLASDTRAPETAEAKRLDATAENATLATGVQGVDDAVNQAFKWDAWYRGIPEEQAPTFALNRDFESIAMDASTMAVYVDAVAKAGFPIMMLLEAWQAGGRIHPDVDLNDLELEMMAARAAEQERKQQEAEERMALMVAGEGEEEE